MHKKQCSLGLLAALLLASAPAIPAKAESIPAPEKAAESALPGLPQQTFRCSLIVVDDQGQPVIGASILEKGTASNGTITDINGHAQLSVQKGAMLIIRYVGYKSQEVKAAATVHVVMQEAVDQLQEVVVVGYGTQKRVNLTGSVSTVDVSKTLEARPEADLSKALQGAVPGLTVLNSTGALGAEPVLTIRGTGTLSNDAKSAPLIVVDGVPMDDISFLNTQDIQSISVLKDAASTSIYGTRAAFGVILITTKAAKKTDHVRVNYTGNFGWDTPSILPNYPDVPTQIRALGQANARVGATNELFGMDLDAMLPKAEAWEKAHNYKKSGYREMVEGKDFDIVNGVGQYYADWDVVGIMFRKWKPSQSHNISVQGTTGKTSYYLSFGYNREEGVMTFNPGDLNKYTGIANLTTDVNKWLQVGARFNFSQKNVTQPNTARYTYQYMWRWGSFFGPYGTYNGYDFRNDIAYRKQAADENDDTNYTRATGFLKLTPFKNFTLNADYTYNTTNRNDKYSYIPVTAYNSWGGNINNGPTEVYTSSRVYRNAIQENSYAFNAYANYNWSFLKKNTFNFMLGINAEEGEYENSSAQRLTLLDPTKPEFSLATGDQTVSGSHTHWGVAGYFGRINYNYNNIWLLELNGRYDGSSRFPKDSHWAFFPSGSLGYRMSEENYFAPLKNIVSNLKIRGSWGEIGNQAVGNNMFLPTMSLVTTGSTYWLDGSGNKVVAYNLPKLVSPTLTWERVTSTDIGLDLGVINNELNATFDWYQRGTSDMLAPGQTLPQVLGADAPYTNAGALRTRGWDLSLNWHHDFNGVQLYA
ncbi:MAG: SusC/RagA family TonB-linked outer membrane protein, partial [Tannerella sp.]|nr:SusC/RagA family TonB-linked outer membrane protein [Tannerella sp.]